MADRRVRRRAPPGDVRHGQRVTLTRISDFDGSHDAVSSACAWLSFALTLTKRKSVTETKLAIEPEEPKKKRAAIVLGEDLSEMSAPELEARIGELETEIATELNPPRELTRR